MANNARGVIDINLSALMDPPSPYSGPVQIGSRIIKQLANGTTSGKIRNALTVAVALAASGTQTIDLSALTNILGESVSGGKLVAVLIETGPSNAATFKIEGGASNPFTWFGGVVTTYPANYVGLDYSGSSSEWVIDGTHKTLKVTNLSGSVSLAVNITFFLT
mgnify:CR=1 FL=1